MNWYQPKEKRHTGIDTTTGSVETFSVRVLVGQITDTTTFVSGFVGGTVVAVEPTSGQTSSLEIIGVGRNSTSGTSVDRDLVLGKGIDTLHDIDFTSIRPVVSVHPPSGPCSTSGRSVNSIHDDHTTSVSVSSALCQRLVFRKRTYRFFPWIRTAFRPPETCSVWSTVMMALPLPLIEIKPWFQALLAPWYETVPWVGSFHAQKSK